MSHATARPTIYRSIHMRSRLEADYAARRLDDPAVPEPLRGAWQYEPACFAGTDRFGHPVQYLPDFKLTDFDTYIEVKPESIAANPDQLLAALCRMEVIWQGEPEAILELAIWRYGGPLYGQFYAGKAQTNGLWLYHGERLRITTTVHALMPDAMRAPAATRPR